MVIALEFPMLVVLTDVDADMTGAEKFAEDVMESLSS